MKARYSGRLQSSYVFPSMSIEEVLRCPKCSDRLVPQLLDVNSKGEQNVWWTCAAMNENANSCNFPLALPPDVFWVKRTANDIKTNVIPRPNVKKLPRKYRYLYPSLFSSESSYSSRSTTRKEKAKTRSDGVSAASSDSCVRPASRNSSASIGQHGELMDSVGPTDVTVASAFEAYQPSSSFVHRLNEMPHPSPSDSPGIGDLCTPTKEINHEARPTTPQVSKGDSLATSDFVIAKEARILQQQMKMKPPPRKSLIQKTTQNRPMVSIAPAPFLVETKNPLERAKAAISILHSAPDEIPELLASTSRKIAVAGGAKQRVAQWNQTSAVESLKEQRSSRCRVPIKRLWAGSGMSAKSRVNEIVAAMDPIAMQHIEMEVHHKLAAKMVRHSDLTNKAINEYNYLMGMGTNDASDMPQAIETMANTTCEPQYESMQPVKDEDEDGGEDWFNEVDNMELSTIADQSTHWSTLTQASAASEHDDFSQDFEGPSTNGDQFDDPFGWSF